MRTFTFGDKKLKLRFVIDDQNKIHLYDEPKYELTPNQKYLIENFSNPVEISISGNKTTQHCGDRHIFTSESETLCYVSHSIKKTEYGKILKIHQKNQWIEVVSYYEFYQEAHTIHSFVKVKNIASSPITLEYVSSFAKKDMIGYYHYDTAELFVPHNSWYLECQWKAYRLLDIGIVSCNELKNFKKYCVSNTGAWSSKNYLPMGLLKDKKIKKSFLWQIEANGSWSYEIGDLNGNVTLNLSGPTLEENGWQKTLKPGEEFESIKIALTSGKEEEECFQNMTLYRRKMAQRLNDAKESPIIFNEYMFASWNCPSKETAYALAPIAKRMGADYFVIDCGWHDEEINPFYHVGRWEESKKKYPEGLNNTLDYIRSLGLKPGLWMEPEVVGALGDASSIWDEDCYFHRNGKRLVVSNRYQLDFRNPKVQQGILKKIDGLVERYGIGYIKLDYNIEPGVGLDCEDGYGEALLEHNRAYYELINEVGKRHPDLLIESCASGGNRLDYLTLSNVNLASTSDQTDYRIYPYIIANLLTAILPEQAGIWCYPKVESLADEQIDDEAVNMNLLNAMIGRVHLASKLYLLNEEKQERIKNGLTFYHQLDEIRHQGDPIFPLGLSSYMDEHLAFGLKKGNKAYIWVYNMKGLKPIRIRLKKTKEIRLAYPLDLLTKYEVKENELIFYPEKECSARLFEVTYEE
ncbi:MAG: alpha-galactosidase [Coprobacillus sp.]|nr:alpha-galactosidase [Coprobacillus sp.]